MMGGTAEESSRNYSKAPNGNTDIFNSEESPPSSPSSNPVTVDENKRPPLQGWLLKQGAKGMVKGWKSRFFVLDESNHQLKYFRSPKDLVAQGSIDISTVTLSMESVNEGASGIPGAGTGKDGTFVIRTPARDYRLQARNNDERLYWLNGLQMRRPSLLDDDAVYALRKESHSRTISPVVPSGTGTTSASSSTGHATGVIGGLKLWNSNSDNSFHRGGRSSLDRDTSSKASKRNSTASLNVQSPRGHSHKLSNSVASVAEDDRPIISPSNISSMGFKTGLRIGSLDSASQHINNFAFDERQHSPRKQFSGASNKSNSLGNEGGFPLRLSSEEECKHSNDDEAARCLICVTKNRRAARVAADERESSSEVVSTRDFGGTISDTVGSLLLKGMRTTGVKVTHFFSHQASNNNDNHGDEKLKSSQEEADLQQAELAKYADENLMLKNKVEELKAQLSACASFDPLGIDERLSLLMERETRIVELEHLLQMSYNAKDSAALQASQFVEQCDGLKALVEDMHEQIQVAKEMLSARDRDIVTLTERVEFLTGQGNIDAERDLLRDHVVTLEHQNSFLKNETNELHTAKTLLIAQQARQDAHVQDLELELCDMRTRYLQVFHSPQGIGGNSMNTIPGQINLDDQGKSSNNGIENLQWMDASLSLDDSLCDQYGFKTDMEEPAEGDTGASVAMASLLRTSQRITSSRNDASKESQRVKFSAYMTKVKMREFAKTAELKALVRSGIPDEFRANVWRQCCSQLSRRLREMVGDRYYWELLERHANKPTRATKQIELDLMRTLPNNLKFRDPDSPCVQKLRRILIAYSWHNSEIGYCQGINMPAAVLLLFMDEEDAFWCLLTMVDYLMPTGYYGHSLQGSQADQRVLKDLIAEKMPKLADHFSNHGIEMTLIALNWFMTIFVDSGVPIETLLRIWDTFFFEGAKVLFRYTLGILKINEAALLRLDDSCTIFNKLKRLASLTYDPDLLTKASFPDLNPFSANRITHKRSAYLAAVSAEHEKHEQARRAMAKERERIHQQTLGHESDDE